MYEDVYVLHLLLVSTCKSLIELVQTEKSLHSLSSVVV